MSQNLNFSISGINTSSSDFNGLPPGALDEADNVEIRYKNLAEPRRGFEELPDSVTDSTHYIKMTNSFVSGTSQVLALTNADTVVYKNGSAPFALVPGNYSTNIRPPDALNGKCKFIHAGSNLYLTAQDGIRSLCSGPASQMIKAGVPKGLNLEAQTNGDTSGFFSNNTQTTVTGTVTSGSPDITNLSDITSIQIGQYVAGIDIPAGAKVDSIAPSETIIVQSGGTTAVSTTITAVDSIAGIIAGVLVSGTNLTDGSPVFPNGTKVVSTSGTGPYSVVVDLAAVQTVTGANIVFSSSATVTMDTSATGTNTGSLTFYAGAQVGYRMVFGRVETDINGTTITRLGAPSQIAVATNISATSTNTTIVATLPKNSSDEITFYQLYRSNQTSSSSVTPLDQYNLVREGQITNVDFANRVITVVDDVPDSLVGIPLYCGSDQEGILQANNPPPMAWDMAKFRDFTLFGNITQPTTLKITILAVGSPSGLQIGDTISISDISVGITSSATYTAASSENQSAGQFQVFSSGTPAQNVTDTAASLIRVINYDNGVPVHAILLSSTTDLPGQILLEADYPSLGTFEVTASAHPDAYNPSLTDLVSDINTVNNGVCISKSGELEAVPALNLLRVGDSSSPVLRLIPLRDYVFAVKTDGIYKIQGTSPNGLVVNPFDLTTKIVGAETAVSLNAGMWMLSSQGVVSVSDGGVELKSLPIDDQLASLIDNFLDVLTDVSFAVGYESDRKYILYVPVAETAYATVEYNFNYTTNAWTTWSRSFYASFVHTISNKLYVSRADPTNKGVSLERKTGSYRDFVDEGEAHVITSVSGFTIGLDDVGNVEAGDILYQDALRFSPIISVDSVNSTVQVQYGLSFTAGDCEVQKAYLCHIAWKQVFGNNPAYVRQFSEGLALFKNTRFNTASARFVTDFSSSESTVLLSGTGNSLWGLFGWGVAPWGGSVIPDNIRFLIPQDKQLGSYIIPSLSIQQGYSDFKLQGLSISYYDISQEVGL